MAGHIIHEALSKQVLSAVFSVHNILGVGLAESAYEGAMVIEFNKLGIPVEQQAVYPLYYKGELAGAYVANLVVAESSGWQDYSGTQIRSTCS